MPATTTKAVWNIDTVRQAVPQAVSHFGLSEDDSLFLLAVTNTVDGWPAAAWAIDLPNAPNASGALLALGQTHPDWHQRLFEIRAKVMAAPAGTTTPVPTSGAAAAKPFPWVPIALGAAVIYLAMRG